MFESSKNKNKYSEEYFKPIIKCSICTGEKAAGFKNLKTGKFEEVMLIKNDKDLQKFMKTYDLDTVEKQY